MNLFNKKSFTIIEVLTVAAIIGILVSIATLNLIRITNRAKRTEAVAVLCAIRIAEKLYHAERGEYTVTAVTSLPGISNDDLNGTYFTEECYSITEANADTFRAQCDASESQAPRRGEVINFDDITIDQDGEFTGL